MDEVFGADARIAQIAFVTTGGQTSGVLPSVTDFILWYAKDVDFFKGRVIYASRGSSEQLPTTLSWHLMGTSGESRRLSRTELNRADSFPGKPYWLADLLSRSGSRTTQYSADHEGRAVVPHRGGWRTDEQGMIRLSHAERLEWKRNVLLFRRYRDDFWLSELSSLWTDTQQGGFRQSDKVYVVQTNRKVIERCILMSTNPGDLVLDPTCGSGTTAYVAEQWGRRWITIDTSRVALSLAKHRLMTAKFDYYPAPRVERRRHGTEPSRHLDSGAGRDRQADRQAIDLQLQDGAARHAAQHRPQRLARPHLRSSRADPRREARRVEPGSRQGRRGPEDGPGRKARRQAPPGRGERNHGRRHATLASAGHASGANQDDPGPPAAQGNYRQASPEVSGEDPDRGMEGMGSSLRYRPRLAGTLAGSTGRLPRRVAGEDGRSQHVHRRQCSLGGIGGQAGERQGDGTCFRAVHDGGGDRDRGRPGFAHRGRSR